MSERQDHPPQQNDDQMSVSRLPQEEELRFSVPPPEIEGYQILDKLGEAGQGQVWRAVQSSTGRQVALKVPRIGLLSSKKTLARFEREVEIAAHLRHPHIAPIIDSGVHRGLYYYAMDLIEGKHLDQYIQEGGLSQRQILDLMKVVCEAVQHAHQNGIIHRDLKPSNIIVTKEGHPYIVDFGLARIVSDSTPAVTVSLDGEAAGTPAYMSPEQAAGHRERVDTRTDVYSLGAILFTLLTGQHPHDLSGSHLDVLRRITDEEVLRPRKLRPKMDRDLEALLLKALENNPDRRYSSAAGLAEDIDKYLNRLPLSAMPRSRMRRIGSFVRRHRIGVAAGLLTSAMGLAAVIILAAGTIIINQEKQRTQDALAREQQALGQETQARREAVQQRDLAYQNLYVAQIRLAPQYWEAGQIFRLQEMLEDYIPVPKRADPRGWEWYYLLSLCHQDLMTLRGHTSGVTSVAWSPDGKRAASASREGTVRIWDATTGQECRAFRGHTGGVSRVAWSPDGERLASAGSDQTACIWEVATGREVLRFSGHTAGVNVIAWSPDGNELATGSDDHTIRLWDRETAVEHVVFKAHTSLVQSLAWRPDGRCVASGDSQGWLRVWEARTGREIQALRAQGQDLWSVAWSPDGKYLASTGYGHPLIVWDAATGRQVRSIPISAGGASVAWSPDGGLLATATMSQLVQIWNAGTGQRLATFRGHAGAVNSVAFSPNGRLLLSGGDDETVKIWDVNEPKRAVVFNHPSAASVAWDPKGDRLASAGGGVVKLWDLRTSRECARWDTPRFYTSEDTPDVSMAWNPDGNRIVLGRWGDLGEEIGIWDSDTGTEVLRLSKGSNPAWSPDGERLAISIGTAVEVWDIRSNSVAYRLTGHETPVYSVSWRPDGNRLATGEWGPIRIWDSRSGNLLLTLSGHQNWVGTIGWSPDGARLASGGWGQEIRIWDASSGKEMARMTGHTGAITSLQWSPSCERIASGSNDNSAKVWDVLTGRELLTLQGHADTVWSVAWSPDGTRLATASRDGTVRIWDASLGYEVAKSSGRIQKRTLRYLSTGQELARNGRLREAGAAFDRALDLDPNWTAAHYERSQVSWQLAEYESALAHLGRCVEREPNRVDYLEQLAWWLITCPELRLRDLARGASLAETTTGLSPLNGVPHSILALTSYRAGQWQRSLGASQRAMDLYCRPRSFDLFLQAMSHWELGHRRQAFRQYKRAVECIRELQSPASPELELQREATRLLRMQVMSPDFDWDLPGAQITGVTVTSNCRSSPGTTLDSLLSRSGLEDRDNDGLPEHDMNERHMWRGRLGDDPWIEFDLGGVHMLDALRAWNFNARGRTHQGIKTADILVWTTETGWRRVLDDVEFDKAVGGNDYDEPTVIPLGGVPARKLRMERLRSLGDPTYVGLAKVQIFDVRNHQASKPSPPDGADIGPCSTADLRWTPALNAVAYRVYLGEDPQNMTLLDESRYDSLTDAATLERCKWYCWRVDAVQADGSVAEGRPWSFSTGDLVGWWKFDEPNGAIVTDSSCRGNHGRLVGDPQWQQGLLGGIVLCDGQDDYIYVGDRPDFDITSEITLACRIRVTEFTIPWQPIITKGNYSWRLQSTGRKHTIEFACTGTRVEGTAWGSVGGNVTVDDGQWHHIAGVYDGSRLYLYVDGHLDVSTACSGKINSRNDPVLIGANSDNYLLQPGRKPYCGCIDDVRVYSYALTPEQVREVCTGGGPEPLPEPMWARAGTKP